MTLPEYINCSNKYIICCDYFLTDDCPNTCGFALDVGGVGIETIVDDFGNKKIYNGKLNPSYQGGRK